MAYSKCTDELIADAVQCKRNGMSNRDICAFVDINETTFYKWLREPERPQEVKFSQAIKKAETDFKHNLRQRILKHTDENWQAAAWMLERTYPDEYAKPEVQMARQEAREAAQAAIEKFSDVLVEIREVACENRTDA